MLKMLERIREARRNDEDGFTLIELLIVIVILGVLAGIVVFSVQGIQDRGQTASCKADVATVQTAEEAYYAKNGSYAPDVATLYSDGLLRTNPANITDVTIVNGQVSGATTSKCSGYQVGNTTP